MVVIWGFSIPKHGSTHPATQRTGRHCACVVKRSPADEVAWHSAPADAVAGGASLWTAAMAGSAACTRGTPGALLLLAAAAVALWCQAADAVLTEGQAGLTDWCVCAASVLRA